MIHFPDQLEASRLERSCARKPLGARTTNSNEGADSLYLLALSKCCCQFFSLFFFFNPAGTEELKEIYDPRDNSSRSCRIADHGGLHGASKHFERHSVGADRRLLARGKSRSVRPCFGNHGDRAGWQDRRRRGRSSADSADAQEY